MIQIPKDIFTVQPRYKFGKTSLERLRTCHPHLELCCRVLANYMDISILCGHRGQAAQNAAFPKYSKVKWPNSKHNRNPSDAVDIAPWFPTKPHIDWDDLGAFRVMAGKFLMIADMLEIDVRWGGDFNMNGRSDDRFIDLPHFELVKPGGVDLDKIMEGFTV